MDNLQIFGLVDFFSLKVFLQEFYKIFQEK